MTIEHRAKLLIVEHRPENILALQTIIENGDRLLYSATSGEQALTLLLQHAFALAIINVVMPDISGYELAELMRGTEKTRNTPIIFISDRDSASHEHNNFAAKGYTAGAVDFLTTPLASVELNNKVSVFVALHQERNQVKLSMFALEKSRLQLATMQKELENGQRQLAAKNSELEAALALRDDFMSLVSHELRTPINTLYIDSQVRQMQLKREDMSAFSREKLEAMLARDSRQIQNIIGLISDMTDVSRIQQGTLSIRPALFNLSQLLQQIMADLSFQAEAVNSSFITEIEENISGLWDERRVEQIIINLLTNALRYGDSKPVAVALNAYPTYVEVTVRDQGEGIAEAAQQRIFEKFERAEIKKVKDGMGMGLYIARQLAEAHHGTLQVESVLGEGATFRLTLPR